MGTTKRAIEDRDARWDGLARSKGWRCEVGGESILFEEREIYFERGLCLYHAYMLDKDD